MTKIPNLSSGQYHHSLWSLRTGIWQSFEIYNLEIELNEGNFLTFMLLPACG
jgi:hypothetical protein